MNSPHPALVNFRPFVLAWLALVALTLLSLGLGQWFHGQRWLPLAVAVIIWIKGMLVARQFIESPSAHRFIARMLNCFIAFVPIALLLVTFFGEQFARWVTL